jgi:hypothetical protein
MQALSGRNISLDNDFVDRSLVAGDANRTFLVVAEHQDAFILARNLQMKGDWRIIKRPRRMRPAMTHLEVEQPAIELHVNMGSGLPGVDCGGCPSLRRII